MYIRKKFLDYIDASNVIRLNINGEIIFTTRQTLISLPKSLFSILFNGRWEQKWHQDQITLPSDSSLILYHL